LHNGGMNFVSRKVAKEQRRKVLDFEFLVSYLNSATPKIIDQTHIFLGLMPPVRDIKIKRDR